MRALVVVVIHPDLHGLPTCLLGVTGPGIEDLIGHQPVVALDLAVMRGRVQTDPLMPIREGLHGAGEAGAAVVVPVVRDHPLPVGDPVSDEEHPRTGEEPDCGCGALVTEGRRVGQARMPIDRAMQIRVADTPLPLGGSCGFGAAAMRPPASAVGDPPELLHIQVRRLPRPLRKDPLPGPAQLFPCWGEVPQARHSESAQTPAGLPHE